MLHHVRLCREREYIILRRGFVTVARSLLPAHYWQYSVHFSSQKLWRSSKIAQLQCLSAHDPPQLKYIECFFPFQFISFSDDPICAPSGHKILDDTQRQISSSILGQSLFGNSLCDGYLQEDWYRFEVDGKPVEAATHCPPLFSCGTRDPVWVVMPKRPAVGMPQPFFLFAFVNNEFADVFLFSYLKLQNA